MVCGVCCSLLMGCWVKSVRGKGYEGIVYAVNKERGGEYSVGGLLWLAYEA